MADITLKDRFGEQKVFSGVDTVVLNTTEDGVTQVFSKGVAVSGVEIVPDFSDGDMPVSAGEDILVKTAVIKKPETLLPDNIAEGVEVAGVVGTLSMQEVLENVPVELDFTGGNQTISAPEGYLVKTAVIQKPDTLTPSNIAKDVIIAGVVGTHEGGGGVELPQLHAPTISISKDTLTITNPSNNGDFVTGYKILNNGAEVTTVTNATVDLTAVFTEANDYTITVKAIGTNFADSEDSNAVNYTNIYYSITNTLTYCTSDNPAISIRKGLSYTATITAESGYDMGNATVSITMGGTAVSGAYNNGVIQIPNITGDLVINIEAGIYSGLKWTELSFGGSKNVTGDEDVLYVYRPNMSKISKSTDGVNWQELSITSPPSVYNYAYLVYGNGKFVYFVASSGIFYSDDEGATWSTVAFPYDISSGYSLSGAHYGNGKYVCVAYNKSLKKIVVFSSEDLQNWSYKSIELNSDAGFNRGFDFVNNKFFLYDTFPYYSVGPKLHYSDDAVNWSTITIDETKKLMLSPCINNFIAYGEGKYIIKGNKTNQYAVSTDLKNWTYPNGVSDNDCSRKLAYGNGIFLQIREAYETTSKDGGVTWETVTPAIKKDYLEWLVFFKNRFIAGNPSKLWYSEIIPQ